VDVFTELGARTARVWATQRFAPDALPEIAAAELDRRPLHERIGYESVLEWVGSTAAMPYQINIDVPFGEPPLTMFWHPRFYIEALFWASSTTTIHSHGFVGGFQVLAGSSVQSLFELYAAESRPARCRLGRLRQTSAGLLRTGPTQMIHGGERFIHSIFHLSFPSVTFETQLAPLRRARDSVVEDDLRLFLALSLTRQESRFVLPIVTECTGISEPSRLVAAWTRQLAPKSVFGVPIDDESGELLPTWLEYGRDAARQKAATFAPTAAKDTVARFESEPLIVSLLGSPAESRRFVP
jgi:hypothetical protein